jgi:hypothetical protein
VRLFINFKKSFCYAFKKDSSFDIKLLLKIINVANFEIAQICKPLNFRLNENLMREDNSTKTPVQSMLLAEFFITITIICFYNSLSDVL